MNITLFLVWCESNQFWSFSKQINICWESGFLVQWIFWVWRMMASNWLSLKYGDLAEMCKYNNLPDPLKYTYLLHFPLVESRVAILLGLEKYGRIDFALKKWTNMVQKTAKSRTTHAKEPWELVRFSFRSLFRPRWEQSTFHLLFSEFFSWWQSLELVCVRGATESLFP